MQEDEYSLFEPTDERTLLTTKYPELGRMKEFRDLKGHELRFVWAYACNTKTNRFIQEYQQDLHGRSKAAYDWAYVRQDTNLHQRQNFCSLNFPDHIKIAVARMSKFDPTRRGRANTALEKSYETCIEVLESAMPGKIGEFSEKEQCIVYENITPAQVKAVLEAKAKAREELKDIIPMLEEGFGVTPIGTGKKNDDGMTDADEFIRDLGLNQG